MRSEPLQRLLICYVPAIDVRAVAAGGLPYVAKLLSTYPSIRFRTQPTTDQLATLLTGTWPHQHGLWGPRLKPDWRHRTPAQRAIDLLPDIATTTAQCALHALRGPIDLATMPPRRHRRFDWLRFNVKQLDDVAKVLQPINGMPSLCTVVGATRSRYVYHDDFWDLDRLLGTVGDGDLVLEMVDVHCLDHLQHWNMSEEAQIAQSLRGVDSFVEALHAKSRSRGLGFVVLSDHGMEPIARVVDLRKVLGELDPLRGGGNDSRRLGSLSLPEQQGRHCFGATPHPHHRPHERLLRPAAQGLRTSGKSQPPRLQDRARASGTLPLRARERGAHSLCQPGPRRQQADPTSAVALLASSRTPLSVQADLVTPRTPASAEPGATRERDRSQEAGDAVSTGCGGETGPWVPRSYRENS
jgi:hypothetical protein